MPTMKYDGVVASRLQADVPRDEYFKLKEFSARLGIPLGVMLKLGIKFAYNLEVSLEDLGVDHEKYKLPTNKEDFEIWVNSKTK